MSSFSRVLRVGLCVLTLAVALPGCGGGGSSIPAPTGSDPSGDSGGSGSGGGDGGSTPTVIQGVATPSSVSVVTATNAN